MCFSSPKMPPPPEKTQEAKMPEQNAFGTAEARKRMLAQSGGGRASTLLTGPSGVENATLPIGRSTLLGQ